MTNKQTLSDHDLAIKTYTILSEKVVPMMDSHHKEIENIKIKLSLIDFDTLKKQGEYYRGSFEVVSNLKESFDEIMPLLQAYKNMTLITKFNWWAITKLGLLLAGVITIYLKAHEVWVLITGRSR